MIFKDICTKRTYLKNGEEKTIWNKVGTLRQTDDGKEFIDLYHQPETTFYVFANEKSDKIDLSDKPLF